MTERRVWTIHPFSAIASGFGLNEDTDSTGWKPIPRETGGTRMPFSESDASCSNLP